MNGHECPEFDRRRQAADLEGEPSAPWQEHLAGCADCRQQASADAVLRGVFEEPVPALSPGFEAGLRRELERRRAARRPAPPAGRPRASGLLSVAAYLTAVVAASAAILARLPWESLTPSPVLLVGLVALGLLSPLALFDRLGIVRPPGS